MAHEKRCVVTSVDSCSVGNSPGFKDYPQVEQYPEHSQGPLLLSNPTAAFHLHNQPFAGPEAIGSASFRCPCTPCSGCAGNTKPPPGGCFGRRGCWSRAY